MGKLMYMVMLEKSKSYNRLTKKVVTEHVDNIRRLDEAESREEAEKLCLMEPLIIGGYATYKLVDFQVANRENNYLL